MREVFAPREPAEPGRVFYTIRPEDVGKSVIKTEIGPIYVVNVIGRVLSRDVGRGACAWSRYLTVTFRVLTLPTAKGYV